MADWTMTTVGSVAEVLRRSVSLSKMPAGEVDVYSIPGFDSGSPETVDSTRVKSAKNAVSGGMVLFSKLNPRIPRIWRIPDTVRSALASPEFIPLNSRQGQSSLFLYFALQEPKTLASLQSQAKGSTNSHQRLSVESLLAAPIPLLPLSEQERIAGVLGAFDDLIETNRATRRSMEALLATLFDHEGFDAQPTGRAVALGDVISVNPKEKKPSGEAPYVDMGMLPTDSALIDPPGSRPAAGGAKFRNGDTLVARITPCLENGKTAYVSNLPEDSVAVGSTEFIVLRGTKETGDYWPYCLARSPRFRSFAIQQLSDGSSGRQRVAASAVVEYLVSVPGDEALARFKAFAEPMAQAMVQLHQEELGLTRQRDELLPLLMSGKVRVSEVEGSLP